MSGRQFSKVDHSIKAAQSVLGDNVNIRAENAPGVKNEIEKK